MWCKISAPNTKPKSDIPFVWKLQFAIELEMLLFLQIISCLSPGGKLWKQLPSRSNWYFFQLIGVGNALEGFKFTRGERHFWNLENVLSPEGTLRSRTRMVSIWYSFHFIVSREGVDTFKIPTFMRPFWNVENVFSRMDEWMDGMGDQKCPSMFFILCGLDHLHIIE